MKKFFLLLIIQPMYAEFNPQEMVKTLIMEETVPSVTKALTLEETKVKDLILNVNVFNTNTSSSNSTAQALSYAQQFQVLQKTATSKCLTLVAYARAHSKQLISLGLLAGYGALCGTLLKAKLFLASSTTWANWRRHKTLKDLLEQSFEITTEELLTEIHKRYINPQNPTDALGSLVHFMNDMAHEKKRLAFYSQLSSLLMKTSLYKFFPMVQIVARETKTQQERLAYLNNIFTSWAVEQKLSLTVRKSNAHQTKN